MFIRRRNYNRPLASILLAFFLLSSALSQSSAFLNSYGKVFNFIKAKKKTNTNSNFQFPYEKTEKEEKQSADKSFFTSFLVESILFIVAEIQGCSYITAALWRNPTTVPLYLFIRALLI